MSQIIYSSLNKLLTKIAYQQFTVVKLQSTFRMKRIAVI